LAWGLNLVVSRFGISQFDPYIFIGLRFAIAVLVFAIIYAVSTTRRWSRDPLLWRNAIIVGIFGTALPFYGFITALKFQSAGLTSLLVTTAPVIMVTLAHFTLPDARLNRATITGVLVALSGALFIVILGESGLPDVTQANPLGYLLVFGAIALDSTMNIFVRRNMQGSNTFDVTSIRMVTAMIIVLPLAYWNNPLDLSQINTAGWGALIFAALASTVVAQLMAFYIVRTFGTTSMAMVGYVVPIVAIIAGVLMLGETITAGMVAGMVMIVSGVLIVNRWR